MNAPDFRVEPADWARDASQLQAIRRQVFVEEQGIPAKLEWDGEDPNCRHLLARLDADGQAIGTARILPSGQIGRMELPAQPTAGTGRMAVLANWRGLGVGRALVRAALRECEKLPGRVPFLQAQESACGFYRKLGFSIEGEWYETAGIPHVTMRWHNQTADTDQ